MNDNAFQHSEREIFFETMNAFRELVGTCCIWKQGYPLTAVPTFPWEFTTHVCRFCNGIKENPECLQRCLINDYDGLSMELQHWREVPFVHKCHAGVGEIVMGVTNEKGNWLGAMLIGPFRLENDTVHPHFSKKLQEEYDRLPLLTDKKKEAVIICAHTLFHLKASHWLSSYQELFLPIHSSHPRLGKLLDKINSGTHPPMSIKEAAAMCNLSPSHFQHLFTRQCDLGFIQYQLKVRLYAARCKLHDFRVPIAQIALQFHFAGQSHFTAMFRRHFCCTPAKYRKQIKSERNFV